MGKECRLLTNRLNRNKNLLLETRPQTITKTSRDSLKNSMNPPNKNRKIIRILILKIKILNLDKIEKIDRKIATKLFINWLLIEMIMKLLPMLKMIKSLRLLLSKTDLLAKMEIKFKNKKHKITLLIYRKLNKNMERILKFLNSPNFYRIRFSKIRHNNLHKSKTKV